MIDVSIFTIYEVNFSRTSSYDVPMPLRIYKNKTTGEEKRSLKELDPQEWTEVLVAPNQKFMVASNPATGKSKLKDNEKILLARARNHSRDVDLDQTIAINRANGMDESVAKNLLNNKGQRRRKIDDI